VYTPGPAFFLAGLFLIPAGPLVTCIAFATALSGIVTATRPHKILLNLSIAVLSYGACSYYLKLGLGSVGPTVPPPELIAEELLLGIVVLIAQLLVRTSPSGSNAAMSRRTGVPFSHGRSPKLSSVSRSPCRSRSSRASTSRSWPWCISTWD
jgi:hypothetical protein